MRDLLVAWALTGARFIAAASGLAVILLANAFRDYPIRLPETGFLLILAAAVAVFGASWRVPARALYFVTPLALPAAAAVLAQESALASFDLAGLPAPDDRLMLVRFFPQGLIMLPGALAGAAAAAVTFER